MVWDTTLGCRYYNTNTGAVGGDWGPTGTVSTSRRGLMHNARMSKNGAFAYWIQGDVIEFWEIATLTVRDCNGSLSPYCGGHRVLGNSHLVNAANASDSSEIRYRALNDLAIVTQLVSPFLTPTSFT